MTQGSERAAQASEGAAQGSARARRGSDASTLPPPGSQDVTRRERLPALRGNCMGAAVLLIIQFALGMGVNLFVTVPKGASFAGAVLGSAALAAHAVVALLLLGAAIGALTRAIRARRAILFTATGLAAILTAGIAGASFVGNGASGASFAMALGTAVAMFCYLAAIFRLR